MPCMVSSMISESGKDKALQISTVSVEAPENLPRFYIFLYIEWCHTINTKSFFIPNRFITESTRSFINTTRLLVYLLHYCITRVLSFHQDLSDHLLSVLHSVHKNNFVVYFHISCSMCRF